MRIGFVGVGKMGAPMALRLVGAGHAVAIFDTSQEAIAALAGTEGVTAAPTLADAVRGAVLGERDLLQDRVTRLEFAFQRTHGGIADALGLARDFAAGDAMAVMLGDNLVERDVSAHLQAFAQALEGWQGEGALNCTCELPMADVTRFGVVRFDAAGAPVEIVEGGLGRGCLGEGP